MVSTQGLSYKIFQFNIVNDDYLYGGITCKILTLIYAKLYFNIVKQNAQTGIFHHTYMIVTLW